MFKSFLLEISPEVPDLGSYEPAFGKMLLTLGGLLVLVFLTLWILKKVSHGKFGSFGSYKYIKVLERKSLSPKTLIYVLEVEGKKILVSESQLEVRVLSEIDQHS